MQKPYVHGRILKRSQSMPQVFDLQQVVFRSFCMFLSFLEKSTTTSSLSKRAAKEPSTILGLTAEFGPMLARRSEVPNDSFLSLISEDDEYLTYKMKKKKTTKMLTIYSSTKSLQWKMKLLAPHASLRKEAGELKLRLDSSRTNTEKKETKHGTGANL